MGACLKFDMNFSDVYAGHFFVMPNIPHKVHKIREELKKISILWGLKSPSLQLDYLLKQRIS